MAKLDRNLHIPGQLEYYPQVARALATHLAAALELSAAMGPSCRVFATLRAGRGVLAAPGRRSCRAGICDSPGAGCLCTRLAAAGRSVARERLAHF